MKTERLYLVTVPRRLVAERIYVVRSTTRSGAKRRAAELEDNVNASLTEGEFAGDTEFLPRTTRCVAAKCEPYQEIPS